MNEEKNPSGNFLFEKTSDAAKPNATDAQSSFSDRLNSKSNQITIPTISLPKGGGAVRGIDEKFSVNPANGTAAFSIPLPLSPGRNGFQPSISLSYNSGAGNSVAGLGWAIDYSTIQRKTDKKLPRYFDTDDPDTFMFSGTEDLVPTFKKDSGGKFITGPDGKLVADEFDSINKKYTIKKYSPRIEGGFARIESIRLKNSGESYWKVTTKENTVTFFGRTAIYRVADPADPTRIFEWLPELSFDDKGNLIVFHYKKEDGKIGPVSISDKNRFNAAGNSLFTRQYLKRIQYSNHQPFYPDYINNPGNEDALYSPTIPPTIDFFFETVFDYGEHGDTPAAPAPAAPPAPASDIITISYTETKPWSTRTDPFSSFRSGFDIRTYRLCQRILQFHLFDELGPDPCLVRSLDLTYSNTVNNTQQETGMTYLLSVQQRGYTLKSKDLYLYRSLPKTEFTYQPLQWDNTIQTISPKNSIHAPAGLTGGYQWTDLYNEGIPGILTEQTSTWYYKSNNGDASFENATPVTPKPSFSGLYQGILSLQDLDADGNKQIVSHQQNLPGFFELSDDNEWMPFTAFKHTPNINLSDPGTRLIDLNGDGRADILLTEEFAFRWYPSRGRAGYAPPALTPLLIDEERSPALISHNQEESILLADMTGDGLTDLVRVRNGEICYWPNKGYGLFGNKITMADAPVFDSPDLFNSAYLQLADISGTGLTDILYLGKNKFSAWLNLSGNAWSKEPYEIYPFFPTEQPNKIAILDLLGNGTACIVWSSPLPANAEAPMRYIDLMGGNKPHILIKHINNLGKETTLEYKSSTQFYLADKKAGTPWVTKLPFPVQCLSKMEIVDTVTDCRFTSIYSYHHGYYDHEEREFRGFGRVDQIDTEEYTYLKNLKAANASSIEFHESPVLTRTWFHTGAYLRNTKILDHFAHEYWYKDESIQKNFGSLKEPALPDAAFVGDLTTPELVEAHRACKGMMLRQEIFSIDGSDKEKLPYSVSTHNCHIQLLQPRGANLHAVLLVTESEAISFSYERDPLDVRIAHTLNLQIDDRGNVLTSAAVVYPRKKRPADLLENKIWNEQNLRHIILTEAAYTTDIITPTAYRSRLPYQTLTYEVKITKNLTPDSIFEIADLNIPLTALAYEAAFTAGANEKRLIEQVKIIYLSNDLIIPVKEGEHHSLGINFESYQLAFTTSLLDSIYKKPGGVSKVNTSMLTQGKYIDLNSDGHWWIRSGTVQYIDPLSGETSNAAAARFYQALSYTDPFGSPTHVSYYKDYFLFIQQTKDALDNTTSIEEMDFRVLSPKLVRDINNNLTAVAIDTLGQITGTAVMGKGIEADALLGFTADLSVQQVKDFFLDPITNGKNLLQSASSRQVYDFSKIPCSIGTIVREEHHAVNPDPALQYSFEYSNGMGGVALKKVQVEASRWVGNGRTILNNKGKTVKQYEPYFSNSQAYEVEPELRETGVTPTLHYDPIGRLIKTVMPDESFSTVVYNAWLQKTFDQNDNCINSQWFKDRSGLLISPKLISEGKDPVKEKEAADKAALHDNTPFVVHTDSLGRSFYTIVQNRFKDPTINTIKEEFYPTQTILDIEGNLKAVIDARNNTVMEYKYDMLGHQLYQQGMDGGERWLLNDSMCKPLLSWDSRDQLFESSYDVLHRPVTLTVTKLTTVQTTTVERFEYLDTKGFSAAQLTAKKADNLIGKTILHYDTAGVSRLVRADFKNNLLESSRQLCQDFTAVPDWKTPALVNTEGEVFISVSKFDALNRAVQILTPHTVTIPASIITSGYDKAGRLKTVSAKIRGSATTTDFIKNIDYDAKGQRMSILYENDTVTKYTYDSQTFRLLHLFTTRNRGVDTVQDLHYTYDPSGNITYVKDDALQSIFFDNQRVDPDADYIYDSVYRLIQATGREHISNDTTPDAYDDKRTKLRYKGDGNQLQTYTQRYRYDAVGNMLLMENLNSWSRTFTYRTTNNQLLTSPAKNDPATPFTYTYDAHGNMTTMPHLPSMVWNFKDELQHVGINAAAENESAEGAFYVYDSTGERVRKVVQKNNLTEERIYLGGFEIFRQRRNGGTELERETLHIMDGVKRVVLIDTKIKTNHEAEAPLIRYQYSNHLGSVTLELDGSPGALIISYEEYYPFGSASYQATDQSREVPTKRYRYTGKERDEESGLEYHGARTYAPWLGRWVSCDPSGTNGGLNLYLYVSARPVILHDPDGRQEQVPEKVGFQPQLNLIEQKQFQISPVARVGGRGITPLQNQALRGLGYAFGRNDRRLAWLHPEDQPFITQRAGTRVTLTAGDFIENSADTTASSNASSKAVQEGTFTRVGIDGTKRDLETSIKPGELKAPPPEPFEKPYADFAAQLEATFGDGTAKPKAAAPIPETPAPAAPPLGSEEQLSLVFGNPPASKPPPAAPAAPGAAAEGAASTTSKAEATAVVSTEAKAAQGAAQGEAGILAKAGGLGGVAQKGLFVLSVYVAFKSYNSGVNAKTHWPVGPAEGIAIGSRAEGILNAAGSFQGASEYGTVLREAAQLGSTGLTPGKLWDAVKSGATPTSVGMGAMFGAFR